MPRDKENFQQLIYSSFPIIIAETHDEQRVTQLLESIVNSSLKTGPLFIWSAVRGLESVLERNSREWTVKGVNAPSSSRGATDTSSPDEALKYIKENIKSGVVLLPDFHAYLTNPTVVRMVREIAHDYNLRPVTLVFVSHAFTVPPEIERLSAHFEMSVPNEKRIRQVLADEVKLWRLQQDNKKIKADMKTIDLLVNNLVGLTESDVRRLIQGAIHDDQAITHSDVDEVMQAKYRMMSKDGALQFEYDTARFSDVAGFNKLKEWLELRKPFFLNKGDSEVDIPKGILLLGVQGCGKSLAAKAVAGAWSVPLLRLDVGSLFNKFIGESERNVREALNTSEVLAPCVLWIDEIEKAIAGQNDETGTSSRILGTLLTWMAEKKARVFIVATSNDIQSLPPELVRKGRLDEIFFVDLPGEDSRADIFRLHLHKRGHDPEGFDYQALVSASEGFSGAEIEQAVVAATYRAHSEQGPVREEHLCTELSLTKPLSIVRKEAIDTLRSWATDRTVNVE